jgi:hypothetical protein
MPNGSGTRLRWMARAEYTVRRLVFKGGWESTGRKSRRFRSAGSLEPAPHQLKLTAPESTVNGLRRQRKRSSDWNELRAASERPRQHRIQHEYRTRYLRAAREQEQRADHQEAPRSVALTIRCTSAIPARSQTPR